MEAQTQTEAQPQPQTQAYAEQVALQQVNGHAEVDGLAQQVNRLSVSGGPQPEYELHRACAEGSLDEVRAVLSRGLEQLEVMDRATGCTPVVLAIRHNHPEVVRELLAAGAIVPPPGLTNDPLMLSILYPPQAMFGMPPYMQPQEFYPPFYPDGQVQRPFPSFAQRKESSPGHAQNGLPNGNGQVQTNLPPAEVSRTIPCRNFPNCKYGSSCAFFHPTHPHQRAPAPSAAPFYPGQPAFGGANGYPQEMYMPYPQPNGMPVPPYGYPVSFQPQLQPQHQQQQHAVDQQSLQQTPQQVLNQPVTTLDDQTQITQHAEASEQQQQQQNQSNPAFIPAVTGVPVPEGQSVTSPQPSQFALSPISPSMLGSSLPPIPPPEAFFAAASPPQGSVMIPGPPVFVPGPAHARRQSFNQTQPFGMPVSGKPFGHGKKPSFSGPGGAPGPAVGPNGRPWAPRASLSNGNPPPPCAFFNQGKCRNGDFCKFPHIDAEGNDCRHPDIIRGLIPPMPSFSRQSRAMRMMNGFHPSSGPFDPSMRPPPSFPRGAAQSGIAPQVSQVNGDAAVSPAAESVSADEATAQPIADESASAPQADGEASALPPKPTPTLPVPQIGRSASQPGVQRVHANGLSSRSHSPAPSNVSFPGQGRRGGRPFANGHAHLNGHAHGVMNGGPRSHSAGANKALAQRVPGADEFPALGGASAAGSKVTSAATSPKEGQEPRFVKTAAQVLSAPAPPKPEVKVEEPLAENADDKSENLSINSDRESDAIVVSRKPSPSPAAAAAPAAQTNGSTSGIDLKRAAVSFASVASSVSAALTGSPAAVEATPVALKA